MGKLKPFPERMHHQEQVCRAWLDRIPVRIICERFRITKARLWQIRRKGVSRMLRYPRGVYKNSNEKIRRALELYSKSNMSYRSVGRRMGMTAQGIHYLLRKLKPQKFCICGCGQFAKIKYAPGHASLVHLALLL